MKALKLCVLSAVFALASATAEAYPILQLDILGGHYDPATETIISNGDSFTLVALLTPNGAPGAAASLLADTYFVSAAVSPQQGPFQNNLGSFTWNGYNYDVDDDMTFGVPPLELMFLHDSGDLSKHSIFPTLFREFSFNFSPANRAVSYNTATNPGGLTPTSATTGVSYYALFNVNTALMGNNELHFDLFSDKVHGLLNLDRDVDRFAPFSHDAESSSQKVPEPGAMMLMSMGLLIAGRALRRKKA